MKFKITLILCYLISLLKMISYLYVQGLELTTPILDKVSLDWEVPEVLLPLSQLWILSTSLPVLYTKPSQLSPASSTNGFTTKNFLTKLVRLHYIFIQVKLFHIACLVFCNCTKSYAQQY